MGAVKKKAYRQGDVLIVATDEVPAGVKPVARENGRLVLAHGEVTGHAHVVEGPAELVTPEDAQEMEARFLVVEEECQVVHEEHATIDLPPGNYEVRRQREYAPEAPRYVAD